jgi:hypothetical protein
MAHHTRDELSAADASAPRAAHLINRFNVAPHLELAGIVRDR